MNKNLTRKELASRWGVSVTTLSNWENLEYGPKSHKKGLRKRYYMIEDVLAFEKENPMFVPEPSQPEPHIEQ